ncbi:MAG: tellurite resistance TerB family protein [Deltaproteobacteria bacterium]|nr:tellurite resistance TerB family protein [Deltaproteobacteria bacterium]
MGFLDKLLADMIQDSTGFNARRMVRRIGGGKMLMAGGAAVAGALLMDKMKAGQGQATPSGAPSTPPPASGNPSLPPLPPVPTTATAPPPPLPPPPAAPGEVAAPVAAPAPPPIPVAVEPPGNTEEDSSESVPDDLFSNELTFGIVRTMVAAALADGHLAAEERQLILGHMDESGLSPEQVSQVHKDLVLPPTPSELATQVPSPDEKEVLFRFAASVLRADGTVDEAERVWLDGLATTFGISADRAAALQAELA